MDNTLILVSVIFGTMIFGQCIHMMLIIFTYELNNYFKGSNSKLIR